MLLLISTKETLAKQMAYDDLIKHIHTHLVAGKHEKYWEDYDGRFKFTYASISRYLNENGRDLPKKQLRVTGENMSELWDGHKPNFNYNCGMLSRNNIV